MTSRSPEIALIVGMVGSAAANTAWTWDHGLVRVIAGLFATALVPVGMHLWPRVPVTGGWSRFMRAAVMSYICGAAAVVNLVHAVWLLTGHETWRDNENTLLAFLLITAVEAVMVMASLARRRPVEQAEQSATAPSSEVAWSGPEGVTVPHASTADRPPGTAPVALRSVPARPAPASEGMTEKHRVRARARELGVTQNGKSMPQLRADVEAAERARAQTDALPA